MNQSWNKVIYKIGSPLYDRFFNSGIFLDARKRVFENIPFEKGQRILFVGVGTGADIEIINHFNMDVTAIDFSPDMLKKAKKKFKNEPITFLEMDAQNMTFHHESFDFVVASLVISVVPDPDQCFQEMMRVLKQEGKMIIFDKFAPPNKKLSFPKKILTAIIKVLGTDISVVFEDIFEKYKKRLIVEEDVPIMMNGMYRKIIVGKRQ